MELGRWSAACASLSLAAACVVKPAQVTVVAVADNEVADITARLDYIIEVQRDGQYATIEEAQGGAGIQDPRFPFRIALRADSGNDVTYRVTVKTIDSAGAELITARAISGYIPGKVKALRLQFSSDCVGVPCVDENTTCRVSNGLPECVDANVPADWLPDLPEGDNTIPDFPSPPDGEPSCDDGFKNGSESDVDCGDPNRTMCSACSDGQACGEHGDCASGNCINNRCEPFVEDLLRCDGNPSICTGGTMCQMWPGSGGSFCVGECDGNGIRNGAESGVDCGGPMCAIQCENGQGCRSGGDCISAFCEFSDASEGICRPNNTPCDFDETQSNNETDIDCGGPNNCPRCAASQRCIVDGDCDSAFFCDDPAGTGSGFCQPTATGSCSIDGFLNGTETDVDCGGPIADGCPRCRDRQRCGVEEDCVFGTPCTFEATNSQMFCGTEPLPAHCTNGSRDFGLETDIDCGGPCSPCANAHNCVPMAVSHSSIHGFNCQSGFCSSADNKCAFVAGSCEDGIHDSDGESDVDCGGRCGASCDIGEGCRFDGDCASNECDGTFCVQSCTDSTQCSGTDECHAGFCRTTTTGYCDRNFSGNTTQLATCWALFDVYQHMNGANWGATTADDWFVSDTNPLSSWDDIVVDASGALTHLTLTNDPMVRGTLPPALRFLPTLEEIDFSNTSMDDWGNGLPAGLKTLRLDNLPGFMGQPSRLSTLDQLETLSVTNSGWATDIANFPVSLPNLRELLISENQILGGLDSFPWNGIPNIERLNFAKNELEGSFPMAACNLNLLREFEVQEQLGGIKPGGMIPMCMEETGMPEVFGTASPRVLNLCGATPNQNSFTWESTFLVRLINSSVTTDAVFSTGCN